MALSQLIRRCLLIVAFSLIACSVYAQFQLAPDAHQQFFTNTGLVAANYRLCTFAAGTTTPLNAYSDNIGTALPNPITLNAAGRPQTGGGAETGLYLSTANYKFILYNSGTGNLCNGTQVGTLIWTQDNVSVNTSLTVGALQGCDAYFNTVNTTYSLALAACANALPTAGGTADARKLQTLTTTWSSDAFASITKPIDYYCGAAILTVSVTSTILANVHTIATDGCIFRPSNGITLTILGSMDGSSTSQHFDLSNGGLVQFGSTADITKTYVVNSNTPTVYAVWFGRTASCGIGEAGNAVEKAGGGTVVYTNSDCVMSSGAIIDCNAALNADRALTITGEGPRTAVWVNSAITTDVISVSGTPGGQHCAGTKIANLTFNPNLSAAPPGAGTISHNFITLVANDRFTIEHVAMGGSTGNGIQLQRDFSGTIQDVKATNITTVIHSGSNLIGEATNNILVFDSEFFDTGNLVMAGVLSCDAFCDDWQFANNHVEGVNKTNAVIINNQGGNARSWKVTHNSFNSVLATGANVVASTGRTLQIIGNDFRNISAGVIINIQTGGLGTVIANNTFDTITGASTRTATLNENDVIVANNHCLSYTPNASFVITGGLSASIYNNDGCAEPNDVITILNTTGASSVLYAGAIGPFDYSAGQGHLFGLGGVSATNASINSSMIRMQAFGGAGGFNVIGSDASGTGRGEPIIFAMCTAGACNGGLNGGSQIMQIGIRDTAGGGVLIGNSGTVPATGQLLTMSGVAVNNATMTGAMNTSGTFYSVGLGAEGSTKSAMCHDDVTMQVLTNPAATCTVSSLRFKDWLEDLTCAEAHRIVMAAKPGIFRDKDRVDGPRYGFAAEEIAAIEPQLVYYEADGKTPRSVDYERYTAVLTKELQCR